MVLRDLTHPVPPHHLAVGLLKVTVGFIEVAMDRAEQPLVQRLLVPELGGGLVEPAVPLQCARDDGGHDDHRKGEHHVSMVVSSGDAVTQRAERAEQDEQVVSLVQVALALVWVALV